MVRSFVITIEFSIQMRLILYHCYKEIKSSLTNKIWIISVACSTGTYKSNSMNTCQSCPDGQESSPDRTACVDGKFYVEKLLIHGERGGNPDH